MQRERRTARAFDDSCEIFILGGSPLSLSASVCEVPTTASEVPVHLSCTLR